MAGREIIITNIDVYNFINDCYDSLSNTYIIPGNKVIFLLNSDISEVDDKKKKMTREESYEKVRGFIDVGRQNDFLKALEALGLIEFAESEKTDFELFRLINKYSATDGFIDAIEVAGYKIVKKDS